MLKVLAATTGTFDTIASGSAITGPSVFMGQGFTKVKYLSAKLITLAETNTITLTARWQVSDDNTTFYNLANGSQNATGVVLGTGTAGADTAVTLVIPAPDAAYGWKYVRIAVVVGVTTGAVGDTYSIAYRFHQMTGAEAGL